MTRHLLKHFSNRAIVPVVSIRSYLDNRITRLGPGNIFPLSERDRHTPPLPNFLSISGRNGPSNPKLVLAIRGLPHFRRKIPNSDLLIRVMIYQMGDLLPEKLLSGFFESLPSKTERPAR